MPPQTTRLMSDKVASSHGIANRRSDGQPEAGEAHCPAGGHLGDSRGRRWVCTMIASSIAPLVRSRDAAGRVDRRVVGRRAMRLMRNAGPSSHRIAMNDQPDLSDTATGNQDGYPGDDWGVCIVVCQCLIQRRRQSRPRMIGGAAAPAMPARTNVLGSGVGAQSTADVFPELSDA